VHTKGAVILDEQLIKYMTGEANVLRADCLISREKLNNKVDYVYVEGYENGVQYYQGPQKRKAFKFKQSGEFEEIDEPLIEEKVKPEVKPIKNKGTGGKLAYAKIYTSRLLKIPRKKLNFEILGMCLYLTSFIEWETGFLIIGHGNNKRFMVQKDISKVLKISIRKTNDVIRDLKELGIIIHEEKENKYRISPAFIAKGRVFNAD
jgi:biotin operon repressor